MLVPHTHCSKHRPNEPNSLSISASERGCSYFKRLLLVSRRDKERIHLGAYPWPGLSTELGAKGHAVLLALALGVVKH